VSVLTECEEAHELIEEGVIDDANHRTTIQGKADGCARHRIPMNLNNQIEVWNQSWSPTKLVVPSMGLKRSSSQQRRLVDTDSAYSTEKGVS
jgi:hypothetical protein